MAAPDAEYDRVRRESRDCRWCGGNGQVIVFHPAWAGDRVGFVDKVSPDGTPYRKSYPAEVAAHCTCAYGRWMRERVDDELRRRIPYVGDILENRSRWLIDPPGDDERDVIPMAPTRADINGMFRRPT